MARQSIVQNIRWLGGANLAVKPLWFLFLLFSTRLLGPEEFGKFMYAIAYVSVIGVFFEGGIDIFTMRELASDETRLSRFLPHTILMKLASGILVGAVVSVSIYFWGMTETSGTLILIAIGYNIFNSFMIHFRFVFRANEMMHLEAKSIVVEKLSVVILCGLALWWGANAKLFSLAYTLAYLVGCLVTSILVLTKFEIPAFRIDPAYLWRKVLLPALPFGLMGIFMIVYFRAGTLMLQALTGRADYVGFYNAGYRLVEAFVLFPSIIVMPLYASFARRGELKDSVRDLLTNAARIIAIISAFIAIPIYIYDKEFTLLFFGDKFAEAAPSVGILVLAMIPVGMTWLFGSLIGAVGRQGKLNVFIFAITICNLVANFFLIKWQGIVGAALVALVTEGAMALACIWLSRDYGIVNRLVAIIAKSLLPLPIILAFRWLCPGIVPFYLELVIVILVIAGAYLLLRLIRIEEIKRLFSWETS